MKYFKSMHLPIFLMVWTASFAVGYYVSHVIGYVHTDAMSRVANAFYVLYSSDPHLGAIGFIWTPLPSLIELPLLLLYPWIPALASSGLAAVWMSSVFAGLTAVVLYHASEKHGLSKWIGLCLTFLFAFNPFIFLFGINGLSDAPFIFFIVCAVVQYTYWLNDDRTSYLVKAGFSLAFAFWTRYEAVPFGIAFGVAIFLAIIFNLHHTFNKTVGDNRRYPYAESSLTIVWMPIFYSGLLWIFLNATIMGNPLYFLNSEYSNVEQSAVLATDPKFQQLIGHPLNSLLFVLQKTSFFCIPFIAIFIIRCIQRRWKRHDLLELTILIIFIFSISALQLVLLVGGSSYGWLRYFMYAFPITVAWLPYELHKSSKSVHSISIGIGSLVLSVVVLAYALTQPNLAPDENKYLHVKQYANMQEVDRQVAVYLDTELADDIILMDSYAAFYIILNSKNPRRYIITSDYNFRASLENPGANGVDFILTPKPNPSAASSAENRMYPNFYEQGADWAALYKEFGDEYGGLWRLYQVKKEGSDNET